MVNVIIIDRDKNCSDLIKAALPPEYKITVTLFGRRGVQLAKEISPALVILDTGICDIPWMEALTNLQQLSTHIPVVITSVKNNYQDIISAMKLGAVDYLPKPFSLSKILGLIRETIQKNPPLTLPEVPELSSIVGESPEIEKVKRLITCYGKSNRSVLITGESGTGKELIAKALHGLSPRKESPFVTKNCAAIPPTLLESTLFGTKKGAYTGAEECRGCLEAANGGTLFLDEIGEMTISSQAKFLRVLEQNYVTRVGSNSPIPVDVRTLAATNKNIKKAVTSMQFRADLYYRLNTLRIHLPPLRERREDIPLIASMLLPSLEKGEGCYLSHQSIPKLKDHTWPGNVRELVNVLTRAAILTEKKKIETPYIIFDY